jgi:hypothetical protein
VAHAAAKKLRKKNGGAREITFGSLRRWEAINSHILFLLYLYAAASRIHADAAARGSHESAPTSISALFFDSDAGALAKLKPFGADAHRVRPCASYQNKHCALFSAPFIAQIICLAAKHTPLIKLLFVFSIMLKYSVQLLRRECRALIIK